MLPSEIDGFLNLVDEMFYAVKADDLTSDEIAKFPRVFQTHRKLLETYLIEQGLVAEIALDGFEDDAAYHLLYTHLYLAKQHPSGQYHDLKIQALPTSEMGGALAEYKSWSLGRPTFLFANKDFSASFWESEYWKDLQQDGRTKNDLMFVRARRLELAAAHEMGHLWQDDVVRIPGAQRGLETMLQEWFEAVDVYPEQNKTLQDWLRPRIGSYGASLFIEMISQLETLRHMGPLQYSIFHTAPDVQNTGTNEVLDVALIEQLLPLCERLDNFLSTCLTLENAQLPYEVWRERPTAIGRAKFSRVLNASNIEDLESVEDDPPLTYAHTSDGSLFRATHPVRPQDFDHQDGLLVFAPQAPYVREVIRAGRFFFSSVGRPTIHLSSERKAIEFGKVTEVAVVEQSTTPPRNIALTTESDVISDFEERKLQSYIELHSGDLIFDGNRWGVAIDQHAGVFDCVDTCDDPYPTHYVFVNKANEIHVVKPDNSVTTFKHSRYSRDRQIGSFALAEDWTDGLYRFDRKFVVPTADGKTASLGRIKRVVVMQEAPITAGFLERNAVRAPSVELALADRAVRTIAPNAQGL